MKHIKTYEWFETEKVVKKLLEGYSDKVFLEFPSTTYFKSDLKFSLIFVDKVIEIETETVGTQYEILSDNVFQRFEFSSGDSYSYTTWDQLYNEDEFKRIKFMTVSEFYNKYTEAFIKILNMTLDNLKNIKSAFVYRKKRYENIIDKLTVPESEHLIQLRKFNL